MIGELNQRGSGPLQRYAVEVVARHPTPPRPVPLVRTARLAYGSAALRAAAVLAAVVGLAVVATAVATWGEAVDSLLLLLLGLFFGVGVPLVPSLAALRVRSALRRGHLVRAEVVEVTEPTGAAADERGPTRRVGGTAVLPGGTSRTQFAVDAPWGEDLEEGTEIVGLRRGDGVALWLGTTAPPRPGPPGS